MTAPSSARFALITGASSGIGLATAEEFARRGVRVLAGVRSEADATRLGAIEGVEAIELDVLDPGTIEAAAERTESVELAGLVNNAGIAITGPLEGLPIDEWRRQLEVNVIGQVAVTKALLPALLRSGGRVVNVTSISGRLAVPLYGPYAASKFAMEAVTDVLRREVRDLGVKVVAVEPGAVVTPIWDKGRRTGEAILETMPAAVRERYGPLIDAVFAGAERSAREGIEPAEVAKVIARAFTASRPRARYAVGRDARLATVFSRVLPDRILDAVTARMLGRSR